MAEKAAPKRRSSRQAMVELVAEAEKAVAERKETEAKPEERIAAKAVRDAVAVADALSSEGVVRSIGEMKSTIARTLTQLSDRLEEEIGKYGQICRAIAAKESELKEIYEIQRSASTLLAFLETQQRKQEEMQREFQTEKEQLEREIETTRAEWEKEKQQHEQETKERDAAEQKRRQRELEEYKYSFAREQQLARDRSGDETGQGPKGVVGTEDATGTRVGPTGKGIGRGRAGVGGASGPRRGLCARIGGGGRACGGRGHAAGRAAAPGGPGIAPPQLEGEKNVLATKIAALGAYGARAGRAACPARTAGRESIRAGAGNRRAGDRRLGQHEATGQPSAAFRGPGAQEQFARAMTASESDGTERSGVFFFPTGYVWLGSMAAISV